MNKPLKPYGLRRCLKGAGLLAIAAGLIWVCNGQDPAWWAIRGVKSGQPVSDFSIANQGQAKWFAIQAEAELRQKLPAPYNGPLLGTLPAGGNYAPVNHGQLKALVKPLYDAILAADAAYPGNHILDGLPVGSTGYPWSATTGDDQNYALVNVGQLKYALSFDLDRAGVLPPPTITTPPVSQNAAVGATVTFSVVASSPLSMSYQWYHNGDVVAGANSASLQLNNVSPADAGDYKVFVSNLHGTASATATLTVLKVATPVFSPVGGSYPSAQTVTLSCSTPGAVIHYTINGQEPQETDNSASSVLISSSVTLKAKAWKVGGWGPSDTESETYRIENPPTGQPPVVTLEPATGSSFLASEDIQVIVKAFDPDSGGSITKVQLFRDGILVGESPQGPVVYIFNRPFAGTYVFTAKAVDNVGFVTISSPVNIIVNSTPPVLSLHSEQLYFTTSSGNLMATVLGVNPDALVSLTLNNASVPLMTGRFPLTPSLVEGQNDFTLRATDNQGRSAQASVTVYRDSTPPVISIDSPANSSTFSTERINVQGTFTETSLASISVNGVLAHVSGNTYEARNVPLDVGANSIVATATDRAGNTGATTILVTGSGPLVNPVQLQATPSSGFAPLQVTFQPTASVPGAIQQVLFDFDGDGVNDQSVGALAPISHTYSSAGQYFPIVTVVSTAGRFSSPGVDEDSPGNVVRIVVQAPPVQVAAFNNVPNPIDVKWMPGGFLYILSGSPGQLRLFNSGGTLVRSAQNFGLNPAGFDVDAAGAVYIALAGDNQVIKLVPLSGNAFNYDPTFHGNGHIGRADKAAGTANGEFHTPFDVAIAPDGKSIAVSDSANHRIQRFSSTGVFLETFGAFGTGLGQFNTPKGVVYDETARLHIIDSGNNRIVLAQGPMGPNSGAASSILGAVGAAGSGAGQFQSPINLAVGPRGVYVADTGNNRLQVLDPIRNNLGLLPPARVSFASEAGLDHANSVTVVQDLLAEKLYVADTANNRVVLITLPGVAPTPAWTAMTQQLLAGNIEGALPYFASEVVNNYRRAFYSIGASGLSTMIGEIGTITPVFILHDTAQYRFEQVVDGHTISYPIEFVLENGTWKIMEF